MILIVGAGAAGLAAAIFTRRTDRSVPVVVFDGAKKPGAKILVSGGGRCNVTNVDVTERDFWGGNRSVVRRVLRAFPADAAAAFFREIGIPLHEEADGKLFPDSNRARDVLEALLREADRAGVSVQPSRRVTAIHATSTGFDAVTVHGAFHADGLVLATGGQSVPKTGSDGAGIGFARALGHTIVPVTPALVPLILDDAEDLHRALSGVSQNVELAVWVDGRVHTRLTGSLLWTHFGISGPVALDASRHWARARLEGRDVRVTANFCPGRSFDDVDADWTARAVDRPRATVVSSLADIMPASVSSALTARLSLDPGTALAHFSRDDRRRLVRALVEFPLNVIDTRGYGFAEVTAGGVSLDEIDPSTMESRVRPGLYLVGEILDVDGRIGGFNFQWAWSCGWVAGRALGKRFRP